MLFEVCNIDELVTDNRIGVDDGREWVNYFKEGEEPYNLLSSPGEWLDG